MPTLACNTSFSAEDYDLAATLASGQVFRWQPRGDSWVGVVCGRWVKLQQRGKVIAVMAALPQIDWRWLADYLQVDSDFESILATFPDDAPMRAAATACRGLRLLRQDPWECVASFILSSTKQIVQIQQIITLLSTRFGTPLAVPPGEPAAFAFPTAERLASATEAELRACKMGFRAPYALATARLITAGNFDLEEIRALTLEDARSELMTLPGVGGKIADCVLLFAYGYPTAFPVDVWVTRALRQLYFQRRSVRPAQLRHFIATHFGPNAGYAQQYLFHYMRTHRRKTLSP